MKKLLIIIMVSIFMVLGVTALDRGNDTALATGKVIGYKSRIDPSTGKAVKILIFQPEKGTPWYLPNEHVQEYMQEYTGGAPGSHKAINKKKHNRKYMGGAPGSHKAIDKKKHNRKHRKYNHLKHNRKHNIKHRRH